MKPPRLIGNVSNGPHIGELSVCVCRVCAVEVYSRCVFSASQVKMRLECKSGVRWSLIKLQDFPSGHHERCFHLLRIDSIQILQCQMYISIVNDWITRLLVHWITDENPLLVRRVPTPVKVPSTLTPSMLADKLRVTAVGWPVSSRSTRDPSAALPTPLKTATVVVTHPTDSYISRALTQIIRVSTNTTTMISTPPTNKLHMVEWVGIRTHQITWMWVQMWTLRWDKGWTLNHWVRKETRRSWAGIRTISI